MIYIVTSLPRTGTTSLCKMAEICGLKSKHVLKHSSLTKCLSDGYSFFADTPFYSPEFLLGLLESNNVKIKFVYSHRNHKSHTQSISKWLTTWKPSSSLNSKINLYDNICYSNILNPEYIKQHYVYIKQISSFYDIELLDYTFDQGWKSFCNFINKPVPNQPLPHLNKL